MTIREYMSTKLQAFNITEAQLLDIQRQYDLVLDDDIETLPDDRIGAVLAGTMEELILAPRVKNISENGFSITFDYESASKYYLFLCRRYGIKPNDLALGDMSTITDKTSIW